MINILNAVSVTLLIAVIAVVPATLIGPYIPGVFHTGLQQIAIAAWLAALASWCVARYVRKKEEQAAQDVAKSQSKANFKPLAITVVFLAVAVGAIFVLQRYGNDLVAGSLGSLGSQLE